MISYSLLFLILFSGTQSGHSQTFSLDTAYVDLDILDVDDGISAGYVKWVVEDREGFLWIGTLDGLNKYNGYEIKEYKVNPDDSLSLQNDSSAPLFVDSQDRIWVATPEDTYIFDRKTESFYPLGFISGYNILEDENNNIWHYSHFDSIWKMFNINQVSKLSTITESEIVSKPIHDVYKGLPADIPIDAVILKNSIWWTESNQLVGYSIERNKLSAELIIKEYLPDRKSTSKQEATKLLGDQSANLLYIFRDHNFLIFDLGGLTFTEEVNYPDNLKNPFPGLVDSKGRLWVVFYTDQYKLYRINTQVQSFTEIFDIESPYQNLGKYFYVKNLYEDSYQNIWMTTPGQGLVKYPISKEVFGYIGNMKLGPPGGRMFKNYKGEVLLTYHGIKKIDKANNLLEDYLIRYNHGSFTSTNYNRALSDDEGNIWARGSTDNSNQNLTIRFDTLLNPIDTIHLNPQKLNYNFKAGLYVKHAGDSLYMISIIRPGRYLNDPGIYITKWHESLKGSFKTYHKSANINLHNNVFHKIFDNTLWIFVGDRVAFKFDFTSDTWIDFDSGIDLSRNLNRNITSIQEDPRHPDSIIWMGTTEGLGKFDIINDEVNYYNKSDGLPNDVIYGILPDNQDNLWISSNMGLFIFDPKTLAIRTFRKEDGLQHSEFNGQSFAIDDDGIMYFGGMGGITWFDPNEFYEKNEPSNIVIDGVQLFNNNVDFSRKQKHNELGLKKPIAYQDEIFLKYDQRMLTLRFALLDLTSPKSNIYKYQLKGLSDDWIDLGTKREVTFGNLNPGQYIFRVTGRNYHGIWSEQPAELKITVLPPWWQHWLFKLFIISLITAIIFYWIYIRYTKTIQLINLRNRLSRDLHDEIGSTLSSISMFGAVAKKHLEANPGMVSKILDNINQSTTAVMESINDIIWTIKSDNDQFGDLVFRMRAYAYDLLEHTEWTINFEYEDTLEKLKLGLLQRRNIYFIFKEALNNTLKYANGNKVLVKFQITKKHLVFIFNDNGTGFNVEEAVSKDSLGGNGLGNMKKRIEELKGRIEINSRPASGTTITCIIDLDSKVKYH